MKNKEYKKFKKSTSIFNYSDFKRLRLLVKDKFNEVYIWYLQNVLAQLQHDSKYFGYFVHQKNRRSKIPENRFYDGESFDGPDSKVCIQMENIHTIP